MPGTTSSSRVALYVLLVLACANSRAVELGVVSPLSFVTQPLKADIELVDTNASEISVLEVHQAAPDVYAEANIVRNQALSSLTTTIVHKHGAAFIRVASEKAISDLHVNIFLELIVGGKRVVRSVTIWLTPPPPPILPLHPSDVVVDVPVQVLSKAPPPIIVVTIPPAAPVHILDTGASTVLPPRKILRPITAYRRNRAAICPPLRKPDLTPIVIDTSGPLTEKLVEIEARVKVLQELRAAPTPMVVSKVPAAVPAKPMAAVVAPSGPNVFTAGTVVLISALILLVVFLAWRSRTVILVTVDRFRVNRKALVKSEVAEPELDTGTHAEDHTKASET